MNLKGIFGCAFVACLLLATVPVDTGCGPINPCGGGQQECPDGTCAPSGYVCCGGGTSCPGGTVCGPGNSCLSSGYHGSYNSCLANGEETCQNDDGISDCAPIGAACCGNHRWCPVGTVCNAARTGCVQ